MNLQQRTAYVENLLTTGEVPALVKSIYDQDGLRSVHNHEFMKEARFVSAYNAGKKAAHDQEWNWHWRVYLALWAAENAFRLPGDFVECGCGYGFQAAAINDYLPFAGTGKKMWLVDSFQGMNTEKLTAYDRATGVEQRNERHLTSGQYATDHASVAQFFANYSHVRVLKGFAPEVLTQIEVSEVAFLHLDMNCAYPEVAALNYFWDRITPGGFILFDDYAFTGARSQKVALDGFAGLVGLSIVSLPTGQGLGIKMKS